MTPLAVPHRDELSDTLSFVVAAPRRRLFYCPDIDGWDAWDRDVRRLVADVDVALLDGTFFSAGELIQIEAADGESVIVAITTGN